MAPIVCDDMVDISDKINRSDHFIYTGTVGRVTGDYRWGEYGDIVEQSNGGVKLVHLTMIFTIPDYKIMPS